MPHLSESDRLNKQYEKVGPIAVLPILTKLVDALIAELRETHRCRPRLRQERSIAPGFPDPLPVAGTL